MERLVHGYRDLHVFQKSCALAMEIFRTARSFPDIERRSLTDQLVRSSRSIAPTIVEGWRKRTYEKKFVSKLLGASGEAAETDVWPEMAMDCGYLSREEYGLLSTRCKEVSAMLYRTACQPQ
jgi:four helix bundle protein